MANPSKKDARRRKPVKPKPEKIETEPDAWERFEHAVDAAVKSGPKHRTSADKTVPPKRRKKSDPNSKDRDE